MDAVKTKETSRASGMSGMTAVSWVCVLSSKHAWEYNQELQGIKTPYALVGEVCSFKPYEILSGGICCFLCCLAFMFPVNNYQDRCILLRTKSHKLVEILNAGQ